MPSHALTKIVRVPPCRDLFSVLLLPPLTRSILLTSSSLFFVPHSFHIYSAISPRVRFDKIKGASEADLYRDVAGPFYLLPSERLFVDSTLYLFFVILCLHLPCIIVVRKGYLSVTSYRGRVGCLFLYPPIVSCAICKSTRHGKSGMERS